jgi:folate-dependent phosphoribosylglycinamide formyltransferase PurN
MRIALFTLESLSNAVALRRFIQMRGSEIVLVGLSDPYRKSAGGSIGQIVRHWRRSGPRFLPYLAVNFSLPALSQGLRRSTLKNLTRRLGIPTATITDVNDTTTLALLRGSRAELIVSYHFDQIFSAETLAAVPKGGVNVHPSLLPRHRGPVPTLYALLEEPRLTGVTVHRLATQIDAGAILAQTSVSLPAGATVISASAALHEAALPLLDTVLEQLERGATAETFAAPVLPYCPFPSREVLRKAARRGVKLTDFRDLRRAVLG